MRVHRSEGSTHLFLRVPSEMRRRRAAQDGNARAPRNRRSTALPVDQARVSTWRTANARAFVRSRSRVSAASLTRPRGHGIASCSDPWRDAVTSMTPGRSGPCSQNAPKWAMLAPDAGPPDVIAHPAGLEPTVGEQATACDAPTRAPIGICAEPAHCLLRGTSVPGHTCPGCTASRPAMSEKWCGEWRSLRPTGINPERATVTCRRRCPFTQKDATSVPMKARTPWFAAAPCSKKSTTPAEQGSVLEPYRSDLEEVPLDLFVDDLVVRRERLLDSSRVCRHCSCLR